MANLEVKIVGIVLTLNEAQNIANAITSLQWCDEVVVVDSGSTDETLSIARGLGARVLVNMPDGRFLISEQRNWALQQLNDDEGKKVWAFFLDADELCTEELANLIRNEVQSSNLDGYYLAPAFLYNGTWLKRTSGYPNWHPRLVRAASNLRFSGGVWESFSSGLRTGYLREPYLHHANSKGLKDWLDRHIRYADWESNRVLNLSSGDLGKSKRMALRWIRYRLGPVRPLASLVYLAIIRGGLFDGAAARSYLTRMFIYELVVQESVREKKRLRLDQEL